jgi:iron complex transport system ATP-binding protein
VTILEPLAALHDVEVAVHGRRILGPVSIRVSPGERWVLLGPNGGGKTTLLSVLGARRQPSKGQARVLGTTFGRGDIRSIRRGIGHASHALSERFPPGIEVMDVVLTGTRAALSPWLQEYGPDDRHAARVNLDAVGCAALAGREFRPVARESANVCCWHARWSGNPPSSCWTSRRPDSISPHGKR